MAKFVFTDVLDGSEIKYEYGAFHITSSTKTEIVLTDATGREVVYHGKNFDTSNPDALKGTVSGIQCYGVTDALLMTVTGGNFKLSKLGIESFEDAFDVIRAGKDRVIGSSASDWIAGLDKGNDIVRTGDGWDVIIASDGRNRYDGGAGEHDGLDFRNLDMPMGKAHALTGIKVDLPHGIIHNPWGKVDHVRNIEDFYGTSKKDIFIGGKGDDFFQGGDGNDRMTGGKGADRLYYVGAGGDDIFTDFGRGADVIHLNVEGLDTFEDVQAHLTQKGKNAVLELENGGSITFLKFDMDNFVAEHFHLGW